MGVNFYGFLFFSLCESSPQHVIRAQRAINNEMAHQLYVLQVLTFNLLEDRMMTKMDPQDQVSAHGQCAGTRRREHVLGYSETRSFYTII